MEKFRKRRVKDQRILKFLLLDCFWCKSWKKPCDQVVAQLRVRGRERSALGQKLKGLLGKSIRFARVLLVFTLALASGPLCREDMCSRLEIKGKTEQNCV